MTRKKVDFNKLINRLILFIGLGVLAHIVFVLSTTEKAMLANLSKLEPQHIAAIFVLMLLPWMGYAFRITMWSKLLGENIGFREALRVVITTDVASALSPTAVGGGPVKLALLIKRGFKAGNAGFILTYGIIEDIVFYTSGILLALIFSKGLVQDTISGLWAWISSHITWIAGTAVLVILVWIILKVIGVTLSDRMMGVIPEHFRERIYQIRANASHSISDIKANFRLAFSYGKWQIVASILILFLQWGAKFSILVVLVSAFGIDYEAIQIYVRQWVVYVTMLFIPTPGASGGAEASFLLIFGKSIPHKISFLVVSLWRLFTYYFILVSAVVIYSVISFVQGRKEEVEIEEG